MHKDLERIFLFEICCSHPCFKENQVQSFKEHGSKICLPLLFFERDSLFFQQRGFFSFIFIVHQIFIISAKLKQGLDKTAPNKETFS